VAHSGPLTPPGVKMPTTEPKPTATVAPAILAAGAGAVVWALVRFWGANPEYVDRFLILAAAGWAAWQARPELLALPARPARTGFVPLLLGAAAFPVGWFLQAQVGPKPVVLWWLAASWAAAAAGLVLVAGGWSHLRRLAFPLGFVLFALPIPNRVLVPLQSALQSATTSAAAWALPLLGVPVERNGFVLSLPSGDLGVAEACSGVRSVTALTAIAAFVGWWRGFGFARGAALVALSVPVIAGVNAVRVVVSGLLQEHAGPEYVRGNWHEALGVAMVLLGLGLIVALAALLGRKADPSPNPSPAGGGEQATSPPSLIPASSRDRNAEARSRSERSYQTEARDAGPTAKGVRGLGSSLLLTLSAAAAVAAQFLGAGAERELIAAAPLDQIPYRVGRWEGADEPVPEEVAAMLTPDAVVRRVYRDFGYEIHVWVIYWSSRNMVKGYHHPDVCWPNRGFRMLNRDVVPVAAGGGTVPVTIREFSRGPDRQLIIYWTQEGRRVWSAEDERRVQTAGDSHDWLGERLFRREPAPASGRLVVLIGTPVWGDGSVIRTQTLEFASNLADEVYRLCPWAAPGGD
jgi:EpsI family protein